MVKILFILILILLLLILATLIFAVGFFVGVRKETTVNPRKNTAQGEKAPDTAQKIREERAKREWRKFLNYDGSSNTDVVE